MWLSKISKKTAILLLSFFSIILVLGIIYFYRNSGNTEETFIAKNMISCTVNGNFLNNTGFTEYWNNEINLTIENNLGTTEEKIKKKLLDTPILTCIYKNKYGKEIDFDKLPESIKEKSKDFFAVIKNNIPTFFDYNEDKNKISLIGINDTKFKTKFEIQRLDSFTPSFRVKKRTSFSDMVDELLKTYEEKYNTNELFKGYFHIDIHTNEIAEFDEMVKTYGDDIIVSNFKLFLNLTEKEKQILTEYTPSKELENLFKLNNVFSNSFVAYHKYVIMRDSVAIINGIQTKREDPVETFKYQQTVEEKKPNLPSLDKIKQLQQATVNNKKGELNNLQERLKLLKK